MPTPYKLKQTGYSISDDSRVTLNVGIYDATVDPTQAGVVPLDTLFVAGTLNPDLNYWISLTQDAFSYWCNKRHALKTAIVAFEAQTNFILNVEDSN